MSEMPRALCPAVRTAVIPVAGMETGSLPACKAVPKELMPVVDKPVIQYAIEEALAAGIERIVLVLSPGKEALVSHFCHQELLNGKLLGGGMTGALSKVIESELPDGHLISVIQQSPMGLGHAIGCARHVLNDEPFAVLLPDDLILSRTPVLKQMVDAYTADGGHRHLIAAQPVAEEDVGKYGILSVCGNLRDQARLPVARLVEKPAPADTPSRLAIVGRYIFEPAIIDTLSDMPPGVNNEIQLTDAIAANIGTVPVHAFCFEGTRYDCGNAEGFVAANLAFGLCRPDLAARILAQLPDQVGMPPRKVA